MSWFSQFQRSQRPRLGGSPVRPCPHPADQPRQGLSPVRLGHEGSKLEPEGGEPEPWFSQGSPPRKRVETLHPFPSGRIDGQEFEEEAPEERKGLVVLCQWGTADENPAVGIQLDSGRGDRRGNFAGHRRAAHVFADGQHDRGSLSRGWPFSSREQFDDGDGEPFPHLRFT